MSVKLNEGEGCMFSTTVVSLLTPIHIATFLSIVLDTHGHSNGSVAGIARYRTERVTS